MKRVAGRQTRYVNKLEKRTGSLWEGRFKSSIISTREYLSACCRYIELNPLRAGMVTDPVEYKWSSYPCKAEGKKDLVLDFSPLYQAFGEDIMERKKMYTDYVLGTVLECEVKFIREALQRGQVTSGDRFREGISRKLGIRLSNRGAGRPKKH